MIARTTIDNEIPRWIRQPSSDHGDRPIIISVTSTSSTTVTALQTPVRKIYNQPPPGPRHDVIHTIMETDTDLSADAFPWLPPTRQSGAGDCDSERRDPTAADDDDKWYPRVVSTYGQTERVHWSRHLEADADHRSGLSPATRWTRPVQSAADSDYYANEDVDHAFLQRKPVSFAIFGKPGLEDDRLADMLSEHWGCVHVSAAIGMLAASDRPDDQTGEALRRGEAVNAASAATLLVELLGIGGPDVQERGYVLTGLPRHDPGLSTCEQMTAVFTTNPPDVLIYMSCRNQDLIHMHNGLTLESMEHDQLTQMLHLNNAKYNHMRVHWQNKTFISKKMIELDLQNYENYSLKVIDEIVKQFDPTYVITVDGRKPVNELFETVKSKLMTMPLHYTVLPEIVEVRAKSVSPEDYEYGGSEFEFELESNEAETVASNTERASDTTQIRDENEQSGNTRNERIRITSEFGRLCPVNFSNGRFVLSSDRYCMKYMGKLYYFAGPSEMQSFGKYPKRFLKIPTYGMPIRAMFYGPKTLTNTAAKAARHLFNYNVIDVGHIIQLHEKNVKQEYSSAIVNSILKTAQEVIRPKEIQSNDISTMRNAIADWTLLRFGVTVGSDLNGVEEDESEYETYEDISDQKKQDVDEFIKKKQLKDFFELYDIDFLDDLHACIRAYDEPERLTKYLQNMSKKKRKMFRNDFIKRIIIIKPDLINIIVDTVRIKNKHNKNWIIINAPLDFGLVKKLIDENLNPIQMVFFHDLDPMHNILLLDEETMNNNYRSNYLEILDNVKNGIMYGTTVEKIKYPEFVNKIENSSYISNTEDNFFEVEDETLEYEKHEQVDIISHDHLMGIIVPVITERLNQYTENLLLQWYTLKSNISKETNQFMDFNIIECKPNTTYNSLRMLIEDTLYYLKKFLTDIVHDVSTLDINDTVPTRGKYDGNTSIYCPVRFANGKLSIGSKKHMAVYRNRYYYMSSSNDFKTFISNPDRYTLFTSVPKMYPKPKISLLFSFGLSSEDFINEILDKFDLSLVDSYKVFKHNVLPKNIPMVGKMYEEPTLKKIVDKYFIPKEQKDYINSLRKYMDKKSAYLNNEDWLNMNSIFFQTNEGICYKNYPKTLTELKYLNENKINPDIIIEVISEKHIEKEHAKTSVIQNWLNYQYILIDMVIARDNETRQNAINNRSVSFKQKLAEVIKQKEMHRIKMRLERLIRMIVAETTAEGPNAVKSICDARQPEKSYRKSTLSSISDLLSKYTELTLKQKKIIIDRRLEVSDFLDLDDFDTLDEIDETINNEFPDEKYLISQCFSDSFEFPPDAMIQRYLDAEKEALAAMREFAEKSNIPWITVSGPDSRSDALRDIAEALAANVDTPFETTYDVDPDASEDMLRSGEVHLSRFGRWCPVQAFRDSTDPTAVRRFCQDTENVQPVVHRKYVYYVTGGLENMEEFARRPLKYVGLGQPSTIPLSPSPLIFQLKIAVLGPPGSGKSHCARELCARYGLQLIRVEDAVGALLTQYRWTDVAKTAVGTLRRGDALSEDAVAEAVTTATFGSQATTRGYVIDGYPVTEKQFKLLDAAGIMLHAVFVLRLDGGGGDGRPEEGAALLRFRRDSWKVAFVGLTWISDRYGNTDGFASADVDGMAAAASERVRSVLAYQTNVRDNHPCRLSGVPVTGRECRNNLSTYVDMCPVCKTDDRRMNRPRDSQAMRRSAVQYLSYVYWTCGPKHETSFVDDPDRYAGAAPVSPDPHPVATSDGKLSRNPYFRCKLSSEYCAVCALTCLWRPAYIRGRPELMVAYRNRAYTFCSSRCRRTFSERPTLYADYTMRVRGPERPLSSSSDQPWDREQLDSLPVLGYLEQTVAAAVSSALAGLTAIKPVYPGLTATASAMVYLGLRVGRNGGGDSDVAEYYREAFKRFVDTCHVFKIETFKLKSLM